MADQYDRCGDKTPRLGRAGISAAGQGSPNLFVFDGTLAGKVLFDGNQTAIGVSVTAGDVKYTLSATREKIISGRSFGSIQLLMVS